MSNLISFSQSLHFKTGQVEVVKQSYLEALASYNQISSQTKAAGFAILVMKDLPSLSEQKALKEHFDLLQYLPDNSYYVRTKLFPEEELFQSLNINALLPILKEYKLSPAFQNREEISWAMEGNYVHCQAFSFDMSSTQKVLESGAQILLNNDLIGAFEVKIEFEKLSLLAELPFVYWIEPISPPLETNNWVERTNHRVPLIDFHNPDIGLTGRGVRVGEWDGTGASEHIDYDFRHTRMEPFTNTATGSMPLTWPALYSAQA